MLEHLCPSPQNPERVVLLGASGFFGQALKQRLDALAIETLAPSSTELNLCDPQTSARLAELLRPSDSLVILSALTPDRGRGLDTFMANLKMIETVCAALAQVQPKQVVYFSSDAVYPLGNEPVNEQSPAAPADLYGAMHRSRELMLQQTVPASLAILRPSLVYGVKDTHNSYGPNRFRRQASKDGKIVIGGEGEETRDHVYIDDIVALTLLVLTHQSRGVLNLATGQSTDFGTMARLVAEQFQEEVAVVPTPRNSPVSHRTFDTSALRNAFPEFQFTPLNLGLSRTHQEAHAHGSV